LKEKILIVEDNPQNMRLMEMTLRLGAYIIAKATDGEAALEIAVKESPDLIIMDMQLPGMSGVEVTKRLRQMPEFARVRIIAVSAYAMKEDREEFLTAGCDAYMSKPVNTRELPVLVAEKLQERENQKEAL
jgi:CheY-like chemotaxis protein